MSADTYEAGKSGYSLLVFLDALNILLLISHSINQPTITVLVGESESSFQVHEWLIRKASPFFDKAMSRDWIERRERTIRLVHDDPEVFDVYASYLYGSLRLPEHLSLEIPARWSGWGVMDKPDKIRKKLDGKLSKDDKRTSEHDEEEWEAAIKEKLKLLDERGRLHDARFAYLIKAYILGEKILDHKFKNTIIDQIVAEAREEDEVTHEPYVPTKWSVREIYENTPEGDHGRSLMLDIWMRRKIDPLDLWEEYEDLDEELPKAFLLALLKKFWSKSFQDIKELRDEYLAPLSGWDYHA